MFVGCIGLIIVFVGAIFNNFSCEFFGFSMVAFDIVMELSFLNSKIRAIIEGINEYLKERKK